MERKQNRGPQIPRWKKVPLAVLVVRLKNATNARKMLFESVRLFKPETVIGWHRELVQRKWMFKQGLEQDSPLGLEPTTLADPIRCRNVLGGVIRDYYREAA